MSRFIFQCKDKNGRTFLGVIRMRSMFFSAGDYVGYSFSITPIPNSKYFSPVGRHLMWTDLYKYSNPHSRHNYLGCV